MTNVVEFPVQIKSADFMAQEALKQQIRFNLGAAVAMFHGKPNGAEMVYALERMEEAMDLMRAYWNLRNG